MLDPSAANFPNMSSASAIAESVTSLMLMSKSVTLPKSILEIPAPSQVVDDLKLKAGDYMLFDVKDSTIVIRKQGK
jgi:CTP-dependent riboflavin kinase